MIAATANVRKQYLADRGDRLNAVMIDWVALLLVSSLGAFVLFAVQGYLLTTRGQTFGKWICRVRIVRVEDGELPGFVRGVLWRAFLPFLVVFGTGWCLGALSFPRGLAVGVSALLFLADSLALLAPERRCLHDLLAGTKVVRARVERIGEPEIGARHSSAPR